MNAFDAEWRARFERFGQAYTEEHEVSGWSAEGLARRLRLFGRVLSQLSLPQHADILELGCGAGTYVRYLRAGRSGGRRGPHAGTWAARSRRIPAGRASAGDGYDLPFRPASFDLVVCIGASGP
jgi:hypothetical protein